MQVHFKINSLQLSRKVRGQIVELAKFTLGGSYRPCLSKLSSHAHARADCCMSDAAACRLISVLSFHSRRKEAIPFPPPPHGTAVLVTWNLFSEVYLNPEELRDSYGEPSTSKEVPNLSKRKWVISQPVR